MALSVVSEKGRCIVALWLGELIISVVIIVFSVIVYIIAGGFGGTLNPADIGPAAFPRLMAVFMIVLGVIQIVQSLRKRSQLLAGDKPGKKVVLNNKLAVIGCAVLLFVYGMVMPRIGFYVATPFFILIVMWLMGTRKWTQLVGVPLGFLIFAYVVFHMTLRIVLP